MEGLDSGKIYGVGRVSLAKIFQIPTGWQSQNELLLLTFGMTLVGKEHGTLILEGSKNFLHPYRLVELKGVVITDVCDDSRGKGHGTLILEGL